jgi:anti-sigma B factor antagonist
VVSDDAPGELREVVLHGLPLEQHRRTAQHHAALQREFALLAAAEPDELSVPSRLMALSVDLGDRFSGFAVQPQAALAAAAAAGSVAVDLEYLVPVEVVEASRQLIALLDEADAYCRAGAHLLTLASPPDVVRYRTWFLEEFIGQLGGRPPIPWLEYADNTSTSPRPTATAPSRDGQRASLTLPAEVDLEGAPLLREQLSALLASGATTLMVDGSGVDFIDSLGVSVLMAVHARCLAVGGRLVLGPVSDKLRSTLHVLGVADILIG